jgi:hypothetical protein
MLEDRRVCEDSGVVEGRFRSHVKGRAAVEEDPSKDAMSHVADRDVWVCECCNRLVEER